MSSLVQNVLKSDFKLGFSPHPHVLLPLSSWLFICFWACPHPVCISRARSLPGETSPQSAHPFETLSIFIIPAICFEIYLIKYHRMSSFIFFLTSFTYIKSCVASKTMIQWLHDTGFEDVWPHSIWHRTQYCTLSQFVLVISKTKGLSQEELPLLVGCIGAQVLFFFCKALSN